MAPPAADCPPSSAADRWLRLAEAEVAQEGAAAELAGVLAALEALEGDSEVWEGLQRLPWDRVRTAEARLRARAAEGLACARHSGDPLPEGWQPDTIRPPWSGELPGRLAARWSELAAAGAEAEGLAMEALCTVDCHQDLCGAELCWQCWHREECSGRPSELAALLAHARAASAHAAPAHRARLAEQRWAFFAALAPAVEAAVQALRGSGRAANVLVLGGVGVSAVVAARAGASVTVWEQQESVAGVLRGVIEANGVSDRALVIGGREGSQLQPQVRRADIVVLEGLEPDGVLGCGALEQLQSVAAMRAATGEAQNPLVLPRVLDFHVALSEARLAEAAGVGISLAAFAARYGGLAPLPRASATGCVAAVKPTVLGPAMAVVKLDLAAALRTDASAARFAGDAVVRLPSAREARPDSLLVRCEMDLGTGRPFACETLHSLPAQLRPRAVEETVEVRCQWGAHGLWFEVCDTSSFSTVPLARAHLLDWYSEMMNDRPRNEAFQAGIAEAVARVKASSGRCRVADLGCGVGLLSALALDAGADEVLGIEITPHLARCARRVLDDLPRSPKQPGVASVECADLRTVDCPADDDGRFDLVVSELLDAGGLGEKIVPFMRHAKSRLLRDGGEIVPRGIRVRAALVDARLPAMGGVDLGAFEPYWLPARASAGEWLAVDFDGGMDWLAVSEPVEVFALDFAAPQAALAEALRERDLSFPLLRPEAGSCPSASASTASVAEEDSAQRAPRRWNCIAWWFEADVGQSAPVLSSAPSAFRPAGAEATHWLQAVSGVGPWEVDSAELSAARVRVRTDGVHLTWSPLGFEERPAGEAGPSLRPLPEALLRGSASAVEAWREQGLEAAEGLQELRREVDKVGDAARLQALQSAVLALAAQPALFGLEAVPDAVAPLLKGFFA